MTKTKSIRSLGTSLSIFLLIFLSQLMAAEHPVIIGAQEGPGELFLPRQVQEGPDGNIYVYDMKDAFFKVYTPAGKFLRKMGGIGEGPGEIKRVDGLSFGFTVVSGEQPVLYFTEFFRGHPWITFLNLDGSLNKTLKLQVKEKFFGNSQAVFLPFPGKDKAVQFKTFLLQINFPGEAQKKGDYYLLTSPATLFRFDAAGNIEATLKSAKHFDRISSRPDGADLSLPFTPNFDWCLYNQDSILYTDGLTNQFQVISTSGKLISTIKTGLPRNPVVTRKDLEEWRKETRENFSVNQDRRNWFKRFGTVIDKYTDSIYKTKPVINIVQQTPGGHFLVFVDGQKDNTYFLLDKLGKTLGKIALPGSYNNLHISRNFIFFKYWDEDDGVTVNAYKRSGTEKEDFQFLTKITKPQNI